MLDAGCGYKRDLMVPFVIFEKKVKDCSSLGSALCGFVNWHVWQLRGKVHFMKYKLLHSSVSFLSFLLDANSPRITWWHHQSRRKWFALRHHHCCCWHHAWTNCSSRRVKRCNSLTKFFKVDPLIREEFLCLAAAGGRRDLKRRKFFEREIRLNLSSFLTSWISTFPLCTIGNSNFHFWHVSCRDSGWRDVWEERASKWILSRCLLHWTQSQACSVLSRI